MQVRFENSAKEVSMMTTEELRSNFLIESLMQPDQLQLVYSHYDRMIIGSVVPANKLIALPTYSTLKSNYFLERRELGIINVCMWAKAIKKFLLKVKRKPTLQSFICSLHRRITAMQQG
jgi:5-keto 4-deoxyuronate isomerase